MASSKRPEPARRSTRLQRANKLGKPSRRGAVSALVSALFALAAAAAFAIVTVLTVYAAIVEFAPGVRLPFQLRPDLESNLSAGVLFFWLELCAIVFGLRLYDKLDTWLLAKSQLFSINGSLNELVNDLEEARYDFAVKLDESKAENGAYSTDFGALNVAINRLKTRFQEQQYCDIDLTLTARYFVERAVMILDRLTQETFELADQADKLNAKDPPEGLEDCLNRYLDITSTATQGFPGLLTLLENVRRKI